MGMNSHRDKVRIGFAFPLSEKSTKSLGSIMIRTSNPAETNLRLRDGSRYREGWDGFGILWIRISKTKKDFENQIWISVRVQTFKT